VERVTCSFLQVLAALDLLSISNLVNYFGRSESADHVSLSPIMLVKNKTKVALYGLGNIRDDRFQRMVLNNSVRFKRPAEDPTEWFSVFLIHQNRDNRGLRSKSGNTTAEHCLPKFLDLVIWGHEVRALPDYSHLSSILCLFSPSCLAARVFCGTNKGEQ
jgi:double-strand break repair protein MRE11